MTGSLSNTQRETAPLKRDNSRVRPDAPAFEEATRPAFGPPRPPQQPSAAPPHAQPPSSQPAAPQSAGPPSQPPRPGPNPTARQAVPQPPPPARQPARSGGVTPMGWVLRGLGLCAIAVVSGLLWTALRPDAPEPVAQDPGPVTKYQFTPVKKEEAFQGCKNVSNAKIAQFFAAKECDHLTRALYTTTLPGGERVLTSVVTVLMPDVQSATELNELTTKNNTGNIKDLVDDGHQGKPRYPALDDDGYASQRQERLVVIGDSAYFDKPTSANDPVLREVTKDALKLGKPQDQAPQ
ncbi:hypothetical protein [Saccharopolyspora taberi]